MNRIPNATRRLVEIVQVEQQPPFRGGEQAEIRQVGVAAQLGLEAGHRQVLQVRRHDLGRAPVEHERRSHHPAMTYRHQTRLAGDVLLLQQADRSPPQASTSYGSMELSDPGSPTP